MELVPKNLDNFIYNKKIAQRLKVYNLNFIENLIFFGLNNSGKRTLIAGLLDHISNNSIVRNLRSYSLKINNNKLEINFIESKYHFEINLYEYGNYDKNIITEFLKYILTFNNVTELKYKIIVIHHFDKVSKTAQLALRRIIEQYHKVGRFILCCENINKIDEALLSRFVYIRVPRPKPEIIKIYITSMLQKFNKLTDKNIVDAILDKSDKCIYKVYLLLYNYIKLGKIENFIIEEESIIQPILVEIERPNLKSMLKIRTIIYRYLLLNFTPTLLFSLIRSYYINKLPDEKKYKLIAISSTADQFMTSIPYDIFALEFLILNIKHLLA